MCCPRESRSIMPILQCFFVEWWVADFLDGKMSMSFIGWK